MKGNYKVRPERKLLIIEGLMARNIDGLETFFKLKSLWAHGVQKLWLGINGSEASRPEVNSVSPTLSKRARVSSEMVHALLFSFLKKYFCYYLTMRIMTIIANKGNKYIATGALYY